MLPGPHVRFVALRHSSGVIHYARRGWRPAVRPCRHILQAQTRAAGIVDVCRMGSVSHGPGRSRATDDLLGSQPVSTACAERLSDTDLRRPAPGRQRGAIDHNAGDETHDKVHCMPIAVALEERMELQNEALRVTVTSDGIRVLDKRSGRTWTTYALMSLLPDMPHEPPPHVRVRMKRGAQGWQAMLLAEGGLTWGLVDFELQLNGEDLVFTLLDFRSERLTSLPFPPPFAQGQLVIPHRSGLLLDQPFDRWTSLYQGYGLSMPWFGGTSGDDAYMALFLTPDDAGLHLDGNRLAATPLSFPSLGQWRYPRVIRYSFFQGGYLEMCRRYRKYADEQGYTVSLKDKMDLCPAAEGLIGAPNIKLWMVSNLANEAVDEYPRPAPLHTVHRTLADVQQAVEALRNAGVDRALLVLAGWGRRGYDNLHPDLLPPSPEIGDLEELRGFLTGAPYLRGLHDNYQDMYADSPSFPQGIMKRRDGSLYDAYVWQGGMSYLICSQSGLRYAQRNMPEIMSHGPPSAYFVDTTTAACFYECYDPEHPITRSQDREYKGRLLEYLCSLGLVVGSEDAQDWALPKMHYVEGVTGPDFGIPVPLWSLVYHQCAVCYRHQGSSYSREFRTSFLQDLLYGNPPIWTVRGSWAEAYPRIRESLEVARFHGMVACERMVSHEFLTPDRRVQRTRFGSGVSVTVNFSSEPVEADGRLIGAQGYRVDE